MARAHVFVSGKVQGVFYRDTTKKEADKRGVRGWVRNLRDGRVEALLVGDAAAVEAMVEWCAVGSPLARPTFVERVEDAAAAAVSSDDALTGFQIRPTV